MNDFNGLINFSLDNHDYKESDKENKQEKISDKDKNDLVREIIQEKKKEKRGRKKRNSNVSVDNEFEQGDTNISVQRRSKKFFDQEVRRLSPTVLDMVLVYLFMEKYGEKIFFLRRFLGDIRMKEFVYMFEGEVIQVPRFYDYTNFLLSIDIIVYLLANPDGERSVDQILKIAKKHNVSKDKIIEEIKNVKERVSKLREEIVYFS